MCIAREEKIRCKTEEGKDGGELELKMSVKQIGGCVQKQQMDWGAAERGAGTQPLFSLMSVVFVSTSSYLSVYLLAAWLV